MLPNPWIVLKKATESVPSLRFVLAAAALAAVVALVYSWGLDPRVAVWGSMIVMVLATVLIVFARASTLPSRKTRWPAMVLMWFCTGLFVCVCTLLVSCVFFQVPMDLGWLPRSDIPRASAPSSVGSAPSLAEAMSNLSANSMNREYAVEQLRVYFGNVDLHRDAAVGLAGAIRAYCATAPQQRYPDPTLVREGQPGFENNFDYRPVVKAQRKPDGLKDAMLNALGSRFGLLDKEQVAELRRRLVPTRAISSAAQYQVGLKEAISNIEKSELFAKPGPAPVQFVYSAHRPAMTVDPSVDSWDLSLAGSDLTCVSLAKAANLGGLNLSGCDMAGIAAEHAVFSKSDLKGACFVGGELYGADFKEANMAEVDARGANMGGTTMVRASLVAADFKRANLYKATLDQCFAPCADFGSIQNADGADFSHGVLFRANFEAANLAGAVFANAYVKRACFRGAKVHGADFTGAEMAEADFSDADMSHVVGISAMQWRGIVKNERTVAPPGFR